MAIETTITITGIPTTINEYLDDAKAVQGLKSDRELSRRLSSDGNIVNVFYYRRRNGWPTPDNMVTIAEMAGHDPAIAIIQLHIWREKEIVRDLYRSILQKIGGPQFEEKGLQS